jgi:hypothetical protein
MSSSYATREREGDSKSNENVTKVSLRSDKNDQAVAYAKEEYAKFNEKSYAEKSDDYYTYIKLMGVKIPREKDIEIKGMIDELTKKDTSQGRVLLWKELNEIWVDNTNLLSAGDKNTLRRMIKNADTEEKTDEIWKKEIGVVVRSDPPIFEVKGAEYYEYFASRVKKFHENNDYEGRNHEWWMVWDVITKSQLKKEEIDITVNASAPDTTVSKAVKESVREALRKEKGGDSKKEEPDSKPEKPKETATEQMADHKSEPSKSEASNRSDGGAGELDVLELEAAERVNPVEPVTAAGDAAADKATRQQEAQDQGRIATEQATVDAQTSKSQIDADAANRESAIQTSASNAVDATSKVNEIEQEKVAQESAADQQAAQKSAQAQSEADAKSAQIAREPGQQ